MRVSKIEYSAPSFCSNGAVRNQNSANKSNNVKIQTAVMGTAGAVLLGGLIFAVTRKPSAIKSADGKVLLTSSQVETFTKQMKQFAKDIDYRKELAKALNINPNNAIILRPIAGPEEYKNIIKEFSDNPEFYSPGNTLITKKKDDFDMSGKENLKFRATLHMHTNHSDGKLTIQSLLDQSAEYADKVQEKLLNMPSAKAKHAPFTIAITDHDSLEGCKEAVKIISENPWKYRNVRLVLGCEMSVENKMIPQQLNEPVSIHMLLHSINPFNTELNTLLNTKKLNRYNSIKNIISKFKQQLEKINPTAAEKLSLEDSQKLYPILNKGLTHIYLPTKDYLQFRTIFSQCFEQNPQIIKALNTKGIQLENISYTAPKNKYFKELNYNYGDKYWNKYKDALIKYTSEILEIPEEESSKMIRITPELEKILDKASQFAMETSPKLELSSEYIDMEEAMNLVKNQKFGYMGIAHPGLTAIGNSLKDPSKSFEAMNSVFKTFKEKGGDRALCAEIHYHYFGAVGDSKQWLNSMKEYAQQNKLYCSGGLDSHGASIFYNDK